MRYLLPSCSRYSSCSPSLLMFLFIVIIVEAATLKAEPLKTSFIPTWRHCRYCKLGSLTSTGFHLVNRDVNVWIEEAEEGFVDEDENLMMGEQCLFATKAFAGSLLGREEVKEDQNIFLHENKVDNNNQDKRLLCAGALVQRSSYPFPPSLSTNDSESISGSIIDNYWDQDDNHGDSTCRVLTTLPVCDAWMADGYMDETNLQYQGALLILDELLYHHLNNFWRNMIDLSVNVITTIGDVSDTTTRNIEMNVSLEEILSTFVVQCGGIESEYHFASYRAVKARGFKQLKDFPHFQEDDRLKSVQSPPQLSTTSITAGKLFSSTKVCTAASPLSYCWKYLIREEEDLDAFILDVNDLDEYMKNPSSPRKVVHLLEKIKELEGNNSVFQ
eukprot:CAMPEP_0203667652 /NCGR_PEP_ID=MMETSP0090-20130426/4449_1 /ASSEMBLY_ACC=CAM_ASM_001088 /TAXON_ID=426623 /ORGANISM="Chaetoceros affinis, Strain CCMP159" /LENGTH=386 /DNA_ID=CAMNT_0050531877 /DNA_START=63 /DNA_END=1223 /DNA_ORIENTATION=-